MRVISSGHTRTIGDRPKARVGAGTVGVVPNPSTPDRRVGTPRTPSSPTARTVQGPPSAPRAPAPTSQRGRERPPAALPAPSSSGTAPSSGTAALGRPLDRIARLEEDARDLEAQLVTLQGAQTSLVERLTQLEALNAAAADDAATQPAPPIEDAEVATQPDPDPALASGSP